MKLAEARLSRILKHIDDNEICFISACRSENSNKENKKYTEELASDIRSLGYSYITILGGFTENRGKENEVDITEASFFVINNGNKETFAEDMFWLCGKYKQESILLKTEEYAPRWYDKNGEPNSSVLSKFSIHDIENGFSKIHGTKFSLISENTEYELSGTRKPNFSRHMHGYFLRKLMNAGKYRWDEKK
jgi:hypothetical protein